MSHKISEAVPGAALFVHGSGCGQLGADRADTEDFRWNSEESKIAAVR